MSVCQVCGIERSDCDCGFISSDSINISGSGSTLNPFQASVNLDPDTDNLLTSSGAGLKVELPADILDPPRCQVYNNAAISIPNDDGTVVTFNSERFDTHGMHSTVSNTSRINFLTEGIYICTFVCAFATNATNDRAAHIRKNGHEFMAMVQKPANSTNETGLSVSITDWFKVGEYIETLVKQDSGGALNLQGTRYSPTLTVTYRRRSPDAQ